MARASDGRRRAANEIVRAANEIVRAANEIVRAANEILRPAIRHGGSTTDFSCDFVLLQIRFFTPDETDWALRGRKDNEG
jgi:hypothetical protein